MESNKEYQWNQNWANQITRTDINKIVEELAIIEEVNGKIDPELVIQNARNKKSSLHHYFEWDDSIAAQKWRLKQAYNLLSKIEVRVIKDSEPKFFRAFISKNFTFQEHNKVYVSIGKNESLERQINIKSAIVHLKSAVNRIGAYPELEPCISSVNKAIEDLSKVSTETKEIKPVLSAVV